MSDENPADDGEAPAPPDAEATSNLTATKFRKGQSGNAGGRPKSLRRFRADCRKLGRELLPVIRKLMRDPDARLDHVVAAFEAVCDRGGYLPADKTSRDIVDPPRPGDAPPPSNVTGAVNMAIRALGAQVAALEQTARSRPLDQVEQRLLEHATQRLVDVEASRGRLLIDALKSGLNKDGGRTLTAMFRGEPVKPEEPKP